MANSDTEGKMLALEPRTESSKSPEPTIEIEGKEEIATKLFVELKAMQDQDIVYIYENLEAMREYESQVNQAYRGNNKFNKAYYDGKHFNHLYTLRRSQRGQDQRAAAFEYQYYTVMYWVHDHFKQISDEIKWIEDKLRNWECVIREFQYPKPGEMKIKKSISNQIKTLQAKRLNVTSSIDNVKTLIRQCKENIQRIQPSFCFDFKFDREAAIKALMNRPYWAESEYKKS